jgi:HEAT repeat protein
LRLSEAAACKTNGPKSGLIQRAAKIGFAMRKRILAALCFASFLLLTSDFGDCRDDNSGKASPERQQALKGLNSDDAETRLATAALLEKTADDLQFLSVHLGRMVELDKDPQVRIQAAKALAAMAGSGNKAVPSLLRALKTDDAAVKAQVISVLGALAPASKAAIPELIALVKDKDPSVRRMAAYSLGKFGPDAIEALPVLAEALNDPDKGDPPQAPVRSYALVAVTKFGNEARMAAILAAEIAEMGDVGFGKDALKKLRKVGTNDPKVGKYLLQILKTKDAVRIRAGAAYGLAVLGPAAKEAVPALEEALNVAWVKDPTLALKIKLASITALGEIGAPAARSLPALKELTNDPDPSVAAAAREAIARIESDKSK